MAKHEFTFSSSELGMMAQLVHHLDRLPVEAFDGMRHRDMCLELRHTLFTRLRNQFVPEAVPIKVRLGTWEIQILYLALRYKDYITGQPDAPHIAGKLLLDLQPKLLHS